jgi:hypothetical protein
VKVSGIELTLSANETTPSTLLYTTADNVWRNNTAQAWGTHTAGDLVARGNVRRSLANTSNLLADASQASIAELKAQWWQNEIPNYLQWSVDMPSFPWLCLGTHCIRGSRLVPQGSDVISSSVLHSNKSRPSQMRGMPCRDRCF